MDTINYEEKQEAEKRIRQMAIPRKESEKVFVSELRDEVMRDMTESSHSNLLRDPKKTQLKRIMVRDLVHFRTEPVIVNGKIDKTLIRFEYNSWQKYSVFQNIGVQIRVPNIYQSFEYAIKSIKFDFTFDNALLLSFDYEQYYYALTLNPTVYEITKNTFEKTGVLNIPIQILLCENYYLSAGDLRIDLEFSGFNFGDHITEAELSLIGITVSGDQLHSYMYAAQEYIINSYYVYQNVKDDITLDFDGGVFKVLAIPKKSVQDIKIRIGDAQLIRTDSMFNVANHYVHPIHDAYYYSSRDQPTGKNNMYTPAGLCHSHSGTTRITFDSDEEFEYEFDLIVMFQNFLGTNGHNEDRSANLRYPPVNDSYVPKFGTPFFRVTESECIEGYWAPKNKAYAGNAWYMYNYPIVTNDPVNSVFISKLKDVLKMSERRDYYGFSTCRVCNKPNDALEYYIEKNGQVFRMPSGMMHYYMEHNVQPSPEFYEFIMNY